MEDIVVPTLNYFMIDGARGPASFAFHQTIAILYPIAYGPKFIVKMGPSAVNYSVVPLERLLWAHDMSIFISRIKDQWLWTVMIMQTDLINAALVDEVVAILKKPKRGIADQVCSL